MNDEKVALRARARANRGGLRVDSARVCEGIRRHLPRVPPGWIVLFDAMPGEPDLASLPLDEPERDFALTRTPIEGRTLTIHPVDSELERHAYGYRQPVLGSPEIADDEIAAVLVPGLAFDRHGGRLGFGAGFYDRFLSRLRLDVIIIGVTDGFIVDRVPTDDHDVSMTHLAGEFGVVQLPLDRLPR